MKFLKYIVVIFICFRATEVRSQILTSFYNFDHVNQSLYINPSAKQQHKFVAGIPFLSNVSVQITNNIIKAGDYFNDRPINENVENHLQRLKDLERINLYENVEFMWAGFKLKGGYLSFGVNQEVTFNTMLPTNLLSFLYYGNAAGDGNLSFTSKNFNTETILQLSSHIGYQHFVLDSNLIIGGRFRYINGIGHFHFRDFNANLETDIFEWQASTDILIESSGYDYIRAFANGASPLELVTRGNSGYSVDLGATYFLNQFKFSGSLLNFGSITWKKNNRIFQSKGQFTYNGVEIDESNPDFSFDEVLDSLGSIFSFEELQPYTYKTKTPAHIMLSTEYAISPKHAFALTYQGSLWSNNIFGNIGINYIGRWARSLNFITGYSRINGTLNHVAFGISSALGPLQAYFMTDNAWGFYKISELSSTSIRFGANVAIAAKRDKRKKDKLNSQ